MFAPSHYIRARSVPNLKYGVPLQIRELLNLKTKTTPKRQTVTHYTAIHPHPHIVNTDNNITRRPRANFRRSNDSDCRDGDNDRRVDETYRRENDSDRRADETYRRENDSDRRADENYDRGNDIYHRKRNIHCCGEHGLPRL